MSKKLIVFFTKVQKSSGRFFLRYDTGLILTLTVVINSDWDQKQMNKYYYHHD